jgi:hypothetical protein
MAHVEQTQVFDERITATPPDAFRTTTGIKAAADAKTEKPLPCDDASSHPNPSPFTLLAYGMEVGGLMAVVGYFCGLAQGQGMQFVLAACCGALGWFVVFLGYGPVAFIIGFLGALTDWFRGKKER